MFKELVYALIAAAAGGMASEVVERGLYAADAMIHKEQNQPDQPAERETEETETK